MFKPILSLIVFLFSLGFAFFYVKPEYYRAQEKQAELKVLFDTLENTERIKTLIEQTEDRLSKVDPVELARFDIFLPQTIDDIRFANNLQNIGAAQGLILSDIKVSGQEKDPQAKKVKTGKDVNNISRTLSIDRPVKEEESNTQTENGAEKKYATTKASFSVVATYSGFLLFLDDLEKSLGLINVTSLSFQELGSGEIVEKTTTNGIPLLYQFMVEVESYSLK